jgi:cold-inducible RNA-binding protein
MKLFVANFDFETEESDLESLFENFGTVNDVYIATDRKTYEPVGYGFIEMPNDGEAQNAIAELDGRRWNGRLLRVSEKREQPSKY